jgi:methyl-accepting chemotaxis protein
MALVKKTSFAKASGGHDDDAVSPHRRAGMVTHPENGSGHDDGAVVSLAANSALAEAQKRKARTFARQQKAAERIAAATSELASGITEAASAATEMRKAADQIASGAEEAAGASQQSLKAVNHGAGLILKAKENAETAVTKTEALQAVISDVARQIANSIMAIGRTSERQEGSVKMIEELESQAATIGEVVKAVARIADQTNLLALNAAIEAARAGQHGKGFAVVADEVRTLAETSEKSARDIQELIVQIQKDVKVIAEGIQNSAAAAREEMAKGKKTTEALEQVRTDMLEVIAGGREIARGADESNTAAKEAQKGSEVIAAAAEEQGSACEEARKTVDQQSQALTQSEQTAQELSELADELKNSSDITKSAEEVASAAEELSSAVEEINRAAAQIMTALEQIGKGAQQQSAASQESAAAIAQIEKGAQMSQTLAQAGLEKGQAISDLLGVNKVAVDELIAGVTMSVDAGRKSREQITALEQISRRIDKIVDAINTVSIQTNMLAVNGSVEAARAGEFGKGFAVVSTDIRNLARESAENADRIKDTVKAIQDQIVTVRGDLAEIVEASVIEVEKNRQIATSLETVAKDMIVVLAGNKEILAGSDEILKVTKEVQTGVEQVAAAAQEAGRASSEATDAAKEQAKGTAELATAIEEIASLADELQAAA